MQKIALRIFLVILSVSLPVLSSDFPGTGYITLENIQADLNFLASGAMQGREAGFQGGKVASAFLASRLLKYNLQPLTANDSLNKFDQYFQDFQMVGASIDNIHSSFSMTTNGDSQVMQLGTDYFYFFNSPSNLNISGQACFAGYAIHAPEYNYNDFQAIDCRGKIVLAYYGEPLENDSLVFFNGAHRTSYSLVDWKAREVARRGGRALVLIPTPANLERYQRMLKRKSRRKDEQIFVLSGETVVPVLYLSVEATERVFGDWVKSHFQQEDNRLRRWLQSSSEQPFIWKAGNWSPGEWHIQLTVKNKEYRDCRNVVTVVPGKDPELKNEYILIGAHYDHEGMENGKVRYGADDNASGVSANLNIARAYAQLQGSEKQGRSIIFAFWDAEEKGMLGSQYFAGHSQVPLKNIKTVFNMDMIGRDASFDFAALRKPIKDEDAENKVMLFYSAQAPALEGMAKDANDGPDLHLLFDPNVFFTSGSDHAVFHAMHIPVVYYFTGFHTDYYGYGDIPDKINYRKLTRITRHIANFVYRLANDQSIPHFDSTILTAPEGDFTR